MIMYSPSMWAWAQQAQAVSVDDRCVNEGALRSDGTYCSEKAAENGWCPKCWAEIMP